MDIFTIDQFEKLSNQRGPQHVSIYTPTSRDSSDNYMADKIHFKNELQEAESKLVTLFGLNSQEAKSYLNPGYKLLDDPLFWSRASDTLVFLLNQSGAEIKTLPISLSESMTYVGNSFALRPLLPLLNSTGKFYILNLNLNKVQLYEATSHTISEVILSDDVPTSIDDYLVFIERQQSLQFRSGQGGKAGAMFHGQGGTDTEKVDIEQYFYKLSKQVDALMECEPLPAILAGVEYLLPMYKKTSGYTKFTEEVITGSFGDDDVHMLHEKAMVLQKPKHNQHRTAAIEKFASLKDEDWASAETQTVLLAALTGQLETLFIQKNEVIWGSYDAEKHSLTIKTDDTEVTKELLNEAAIQTLLKGGTVYPCEGEDMPAKNSVAAAIFRNPVR
jgi:hypothetical protein